MRRRENRLFLLIGDSIKTELMEDIITIMQFKLIVHSKEHFVLFLGHFDLNGGVRRSGDNEKGDHVFVLVLIYMVKKKRERDYFLLSIENYRQ